MTQDKAFVNNVPAMPIRDLVIFPGMLTHFDVVRDRSVKALEEAMEQEKLIVLITQIDGEIELPMAEDLYDFACICKVKQLLKMPGEKIRVLIEGLDRVEILRLYDDLDYFTADIKILESYCKNNGAKLEAKKRALKEAYEEYIAYTGRLNTEELETVMGLDDAASFSDAVSSSIDMDIENRQEFLEILEVDKRISELLKLVKNELKVFRQLKILNKKFDEQINQSQKEYILRERLRVIKNELGEDDAEEKEVEEFRKKLSDLNLDEKINKKITDEIEKYSRTNSYSPESSTLRTYLQNFFELPWNKYSDDTDDISETRRVLEEDHYGLEDVKERIVEHLAIRKMTEDYKGSVICLVGPPGVGKTSIAKSIARSMNRKFTRMSLGGVRDESEIRGHRRTYVGSISGRIISAMKEAGTMNPVFLFDEIDKLANDFNGDPASALLEVFDKNQNSEFVDRYLEVPFDLSKVIFITTANTLSTIPGPLRDRMEIIEISSYTAYEKFHIAKNYLVKKQIKEHGLKSSMIKFSDKTLEHMIRSYTRESGVRDLERKIGKICRKVTCSIVEGKFEKVSITNKNIKDFLGVPRKLDDSLPEKDQVGVVTGLAWTQVGGETLVIEAVALNGTGKIQLTGQMGSVMKESAAAAISYVRKKSVELGIDPYFYKKYDLHIHIPEGAVPKDGPSAGVTMTTALASVLSGIPVNRMVAMTGEITLTGRVLQIGGLKEKILAALRLGIKTIIIPESNLKDLEKIPNEILEQLEFKPVKHLDEVIDIAFVRKPKKLSKKEIKAFEQKGSKNFEDKE